MTNYVGLGALIRRELKRTYMVINQVVWPPVIMTLLFIFIFGLSLGSRIRTLGGVPYVEFLLPGLVMLNVISSSYDESSSSLFQQRFMNSIQELLIAPLSSAELVVGFLTGSVLRGLVIGNLVMLIGLVLVHAAPHNLAIYVYFMCVTALLFSAFGMIAGLLGKTWDNLAIFTTFVITPLTYIGGVFSSLSLLPPLLQRISLVNPMVYMIDGFRSSYTGMVDIDLRVDAIVVTVLAAIALGIAFVLTKRGVNLRV
ncbi:MAG: ABC transporter permease [Candidatus Eremiobacteraeota bacterium]|nr:ABC transporter permease [Candidatus Eremiobacteraeota bacterium]MBV8668657.1 ABC transporter permease [Candidatus Eremiobacteraeota bacterium]